MEELDSDSFASGRGTFEGQFAYFDNAISIFRGSISSGIA